MKKNEYKGDGFLFFRAVKESENSADEIRESMDVSNGTFYRLYRKEAWSDYEKKLAAKALQKPISEIFSNERLQSLLRAATGNDSIKVEDLSDEIEKNKINVPTSFENRKGTTKFIPPQSKPEDEESMYQTLNAEMVRHLMNINMRLVETNAVLARKVPDQHEAEMPAKKRRHG